MNRVTQSYVTVAVTTQTHGGFIRARDTIRVPLLCTCDDPQSVVVSTGPVMCRTCGRRVGER